MACCSAPREKVFEGIPAVYEWTLRQKFATWRLRLRSWSRPLGLTVEGGLAASQLLTLYITTVVYIYMEWFRHMGDKLHFRRESKPARMPVETY